MAGFPKGINLDKILERLLITPPQKPGKRIHIRLQENEIHQLCDYAQQIFLAEPMVIQIQAPIVISGDIHGQYRDLLRLFSIGGYPPNSRYLFLGDYVDRGENSIEVFCLLIAYKIKFPKSFYMIRGNHESASLNRLYGFFDECKRRYSINLWKSFLNVFNVMPVCAIIEKKIFCVHGGLSPYLQALEQILEIRRPTDIPDQGLLCDLVWSDPDNRIMGWGNNERGISFTFGADIVEQFNKKFGFDLICRAHQVVDGGYEFFAQHKLVTIFSAPDYVGLGNEGAIMNVTNDLFCTFKTIQPLIRRRLLSNKSNILRRII